MKSLRRIVVTLVIALAGLSMTGCSASPNVGFEGVLIEKPAVFGHGGIDSDPVKTGLTFISPTTEVIYVNMQPIQADLDMKDIMTSDGVPLEFDAVIRVQVTDSVKLIQNFGENWYDNNVKSQFFNLVRQQVKQHGMNETAIQPTAIEEIDSKVGAEMEAYFKSINIPVRLIQVTVGKANPPDAIKHQRIETAQQEQRILTEQQRKLAEDSRKNAEYSRAEADNAYRNAMSLSPDQFLQLERIKMQHDACTQGAKCTMFMGETKPIIVNGKD